MMLFSPSHVPRLRALAARLHELRFGDAVRALCGDLPVYRYRQAMRDLHPAARPAAIDEPAWAAVSLFFLGRPLPLSAIHDLIGLDRDTLDALIATGLLTCDEHEARCDRCGLLPLQGALFIVSRLLHARSAPGSNAAYFGQDTMELVREALADPRASMLEVGCGAGIVGILAQREEARRRVIGVELCEEAVEIARVNAAINDVAYDVRRGDLFAPVQG